MIFLLAALAALCSWLMPNHYQPWLAFHAEFAMAVAGLLVVAGVLFERDRSPWAWPRLALVAAALAAVPWLQFAAGLIGHAGDAFTASAFLLAFALAIVAGVRLGHRHGAAVVLDAMAGWMLAAAILSVGVQLYQWLRLTGLGIFAVELAPLRSPYGNVAQANHLASMLFLGWVGLLHLRLRGRVGTGPMLLASAFLLGGMAMTGSRTAWLLVALTLAVLALLRRRGLSSIGPGAIAACGVVFFAAVAAWPVVNDLLLLSPGRSFASQAEAGPRPLLWATMLDAIGHRPLAGYGWNQGLLAQAAVVEQHPAGGRLIENAHNLVLDLMVWNGIPLGLAIAGALALWFVRRLREGGDANRALLLLAVGGLLLHAQLEFPLSYLYFLLPVGLMMGLVESARPAPAPMPVLPRTAALAGGLAALAATGLTLRDYAEVEPNLQTLQYEVARIGAHDIESTTPSLWVLTQWTAFLDASRVQPRPGLDAATLDRLREAANRHGAARLQLLSARADALNGRPDAAATMLRRLCALQNRAGCESSLREWREAVAEAPALRAVPLPVLDAAAARLK